METQDLFRTVKSLGVGATAEVFWAVNLQYDKNVALKVFNPIVYQDAEALSRLKREVESLEKLRHPNVVALLGEHVQEKFYALELELVEGSDLRVWQKNNDSKLIEDRLWILAQVARGLGAAHELEILHRDLKPENILISEAGEVKITDFGLARQLDRLTMTRLGLLTGSLGYMAPEIINGGKATSQSDIFSFGVLAYELLCGVSPFVGETPQALLKAVVERKEVSLKEKNPLVPRRIATLIEKTLEKDPLLRPESIWVLESEILSYLASTRLLAHCRTMMNIRSRNEFFAMALSIKHKSLQTEVKTLFSSSSPQSRIRLLEIVQELMILFPDDRSVEAILQKLNPEVSRWRAIVALVLLLFSIIGGSYLIWVRSVAPVKSLIASIPVPQKILGGIKFLADPDVVIVVDGQRVPADQWRNFNVEPGKHIFKLIKPGFLPIENKVEVVAGKTVTINAR